MIARLGEIELLDDAGSVLASRELVVGRHYDGSFCFSLSDVPTVDGPGIATSFALITNNGLLRYQWPIGELKSPLSRESAWPPLP